MGVHGKKLALSGAAVAMFATLLLLTYVIHARYLPVDVVFYSALQDAVIATAASALLLWTTPLFRVLGSIEKLHLVVIWLLGGYAFAISIPTVIDRSLSFYLLEKIEQRGGGIRQEALQKVLVEEFMEEYRVLDARLTEQLESGTIVIENGCVRLTASGRRVAHVGSAFRAHLLPKRRQLMGEYSDDLTAPFRRSTDDVDYRCP